MSAVVKWQIIQTFLLLLALKEARSSQEIIKKLTLGFSKAVEQCKDEMNLSDHIMQDFYSFWKEEYQLLNRDIGCAIMCMALKLDLVTEDFKLHHGRAHEFAKTHGADDGIAKQLVTMIHQCESDYIGIEDDCNRVLEIAKCFRTKIHALQWAPSMETVLEEIMTEV